MGRANPGSGRPRNNPDELVDKRVTWRDRDGEIVSPGAKRTTNLTVSLYPGDQELLEFIQNYLGVNKSAAARAAIQSFAAHLAFIAGSRQK